MAILTAGVFGLDFDQLDIGSLSVGAYQNATPTAFSVAGNGQLTSFSGTGFTYGSGGVPTGGIITRIQESANGAQVYDLTGLSTPATTFMGWVAGGSNAAARIGLMSGADSGSGSGLTDRLRGYAGDDTITGGGGSDYLDGGDGDDDVFGGLDNDTVVDSAGSNYLRGDEGADQVLGGADFDDINGNMGNDTCSGGPSDDWVVGGRDQDLLFGYDGVDIVYGYLGDDTCDGGVGNDLIRGGQGSDTLAGGAGDDWLSGDRGDDTMSGGSGADIFHSFGEAGVDRVLDFSLSQGDRIQLDPGTLYTVSQSGADTLITMTGGGQLVLVGITASSLTATTIFLA